MSAFSIVDAGSPPDGPQYIAPEDRISTDFCYCLPRTGARWLCLWGYTYDGVVENPAIFKTTDGGATWTLTGASSAPQISLNLITPLAYDSRFNILNPAAESSITIYYDDENDTTSGVFPNIDQTCHTHLVDFDFATETYGTPYGNLDLLNLIAFKFSSLPAGGGIITYWRQASIFGHTSIGAFYRIFSGGAWGAEQALSSGDYKPVNLAVDGSGNAHIIVEGGGARDYFRVDSSGTIVEGPTSIYATGYVQNLSLIGGDLILLLIAGSGLSLNFTILIGSPASSPTWTSDIVSASVQNNVGVAWYTELDGSAYNADMELFGSTSGVNYDYTVDSNQSGLTGPTIHYPSGDLSTVYMINKVAGTWGAPTALWSTGPATVHGMFAMVARGPVTAPVSDLCRYRPILTT